MYGNVSTANSKIGVDSEVSGGLYGAGRFGYSLNNYSASVGTLSKTAASSASIAYQDGINPSEFTTFTVPLTSLSGSDSEAVRSFRLISASVDVTSNPELTSATATNVIFVVTGSLVVASTITTAAVFYSVQPTDSSRGDFEDGSTKVPTTGTNAPSTISIPEINVTLASEAIVAKTRKLKAQWTPRVCTRFKCLSLNRC